MCVSSRLSSRGITLIEVLITLTLFTFIALSLMRMTNRTLQYRGKLVRNITDAKIGRHVGQVLKKDLANMFYKQDVNHVIYQVFLKNQERLAKSNPLPKAHEKPLHDRLNQFKAQHITPYLPTALPLRSANIEQGFFVGGMHGKQNSLRITSLSRVRQNGVGGDQVTVLYYLKSCHNRRDRKEKTLCLWRQFTPVIYKDLDTLKDFNELVLLERVKKFELSYYDQSINEWKKDWKTGLNERRGLPSAIRVILEFEDSKKRLVKEDIQMTLFQQVILPVGR